MTTTPLQPTIRPRPLVPFDVMLHGKLVATVYFAGMTAEEVRRSLIEHDGMSPAINVYRSVR